jgi:hypothetical protein
MDISQREAFRDAIAHRANKITEKSQKIDFITHRHAQAKFLNPAAALGMLGATVGGIKGGLEQDPYGGYISGGDRLKRIGINTLVGGGVGAGGGAAVKYISPNIADALTPLEQGAMNKVAESISDPLQSAQAIAANNRKAQSAVETTVTERAARNAAKEKQRELAAAQARQRSEAIKLKYDERIKDADTAAAVKWQNTVDYAREGVGAAKEVIANTTRLPKTVARVGRGVVGSLGEAAYDAGAAAAASPVGQAIKAAPGVVAEKAPQVIRNVNADIAQVSQDLNDSGPFWYNPGTQLAYLKERAKADIGRTVGAVRNSLRKPPTPPDGSFGYSDVDILRNLGYDPTYIQAKFGKLPRAKDTKRMLSAAEKYALVGLGAGGAAGGAIGVASGIKENRQRERRAMSDIYAIADPYRRVEAYDDYSTNPDASLRLAGDVVNTLGQGAAVGGVGSLVGGSLLGGGKKGLEMIRGRYGV